MKDALTGKSRGFGFVTYASTKDVDDVLKRDHFLDGKRVRTFSALYSR